MSSEPTTEVTVQQTLPGAIVDAFAAACSLDTSQVTEIHVVPDVATVTYFLHKNGRPYVDASSGHLATLTVRIPIVWAER